jgi:alpha-mannosidase
VIVHMIGNAHIDPVWLWRWQAGVDEALATFRSAADRCEEYPEFVFTRGESWVYEQVERLAPDLFERVKSGQWHVTGGQYL